MIFYLHVDDYELSNRCDISGDVALESIREIKDDINFESLTYTPAYFDLKLYDNNHANVLDIKNYYTLLTTHTCYVSIVDDDDNVLFNGKCDSNVTREIAQTTTYTRVKVKSRVAELNERKINVAKTNAVDLQKYLYSIVNAPESVLIDEYEIDGNYNLFNIDIKYDGSVLYPKNTIKLKMTADEHWVLLKEKAINTLYVHTRMDTVIANNYASDTSIDFVNKGYTFYSEIDTITYNAGTGVATITVKATDFGLYDLLQQQGIDYYYTGGVYKEYNFVYFDYIDDVLPGLRFRYQKPTQKAMIVSDVEKCLRTDVEIQEVIEAYTQTTHSESAYVFFTSYGSLQSYIPVTWAIKKATLPKDWYLIRLSRDGNDEVAIDTYQPWYYDSGVTTIEQIVPQIISKCYDARYLYFRVVMKANSIWTRGLYTLDTNAMTWSSNTEYAGLYSYGYTFDITDLVYTVPASTTSYAGNIITFKTPLCYTYDSIDYYFIPLYTVVNSGLKTSYVYMKHQGGKSYITQPVISDLNPAAQNTHDLLIVCLSGTWYEIADVLVYPVIEMRYKNGAEYTVNQDKQYFHGIKDGLYYKYVMTYAAFDTSDTGDVGFGISKDIVDFVEVGAELYPHGTAFYTGNKKIYNVNTSVEYDVKGVAYEVLKKIKSLYAAMVMYTDRLIIKSVKSVLENINITAEITDFELVELKTISKKDFVQNLTGVDNKILKYLLITKFSMLFTRNSYNLITIRAKKDVTMAQYVDLVTENDTYATFVLSKKIKTDTKMKEYVLLALRTTTLSAYQLRV